MSLLEDMKEQRLVNMDNRIAELEKYLKETEEWKTTAEYWIDRHNAIKHENKNLREAAQAVVGAWNNDDFVALQFGKYMDSLAKLLEQGD